eukprot:PhF_6_TR22244/c0_g1_i2/m.31417
MKRNRDDSFDSDDMMESFPTSLSELVMPPSAMPHPTSASSYTPIEVRVDAVVRCVGDEFKVELRSLEDLLREGEGEAAQSTVAGIITPVLGPIPPTSFPFSPRSNYSTPTSYCPQNITTPNTLRGTRGQVPVDPLKTSATYCYHEILRTFNPATDVVELFSPGEEREAFLACFEKICNSLILTLESQSVFFTVQAPCYTIGDLHGNIADLKFFLRNIIPFDDPSLCPTRLVFLGDYVDRGSNSLACVAVVFALKILNPNAIHLLRGNHEDIVVCSDTHTYGKHSFASECSRLFGAEQGKQVFELCCKVFQHLPLACDVAMPSGRHVLCTHGGIPRFDSSPLNFDTIALLKSPDFPHFHTIFVEKLFDDDTPEVEQIRLSRCWTATLDILWSDPTSDDHSDELDEAGFSQNNRGSGVVCFSSKAVNAFLAAHGYDLLVRAHQEKVFGLKLSKSSKVLTIFSSSNYQGNQNNAGCAFIDADGAVHMILRKL